MVYFQRSKNEMHESLKDMAARNETMKKVKYKFNFKMFIFKIYFFFINRKKYFTQI